MRLRFAERARVAWGDGVRIDGRVMGEWSDLALFRP